LKGPERLLRSEDRWVTRMGAWFPGERVVFRGKDLFHDFRDLPWMALLVYGITGQVPDVNAVRLLEGLWKFSTSYPDPRLWNNRIAAFAGTARSSTALAISAANAVSEATVYGFRPNIRAMDFLLRTQAKLEQGAQLEQVVVSELRARRVIAGYGRPIVRRDERIEPIMRLATELGFADGPYVRLAFEVERVLITGRWRQHMNVAALAAGLVADLGFSPNEFYQYSCLSFSAGLFPCYQDGLAKAEGTLFPLRCTRVKYAGSPHRTWGATRDTS
jgi:citrate synthase